MCVPLSEYVFGAAGIVAQAAGVVFFGHSCEHLLELATRRLRQQDVVEANEAVMTGSTSARL
jgi:hypothetical protein